MCVQWNLHPLMLLLLLSWRGVNSTEQPAQVSKPNSTEIKTLSVLIKGESHTEHVEVLKAVSLALECTWAGHKNKLPNMSGFWTKDGSEVDGSRLTVPLQNEQYHLKRAFNITGEGDLGNYSCVFGDEAHGDFIVAAPQMGEVRDKPIVSYVGDSVIITCKMEDIKPKPNTWTWYRANGTDKEELVDTGVDSHRYHILNDKGKTRLTVSALTEADTGAFYCGAVYDISTSMSRVELRVITYLEPLKPFIAIMVEVLVLVCIILLCEKRNSKSAPGNVANADQTDQTLTQGQSNGMEGSSSTRQRKV